MTMETVHRDMVEAYKSSIINFINLSLKANNIGELEFNQPFRVWTTESTIDGDTMMVPLVAKGMVEGNVIVTDQDEFVLKELDIYELSYIADVIASNEFKTVCAADEFK